ncbi:MAG: hypothetical protein FWD73_16805 [Polyangiaceae bacterium]|nr:hypothetical protein [Polyangiaceae bacterium]
MMVRQLLVANLKAVACVSCLSVSVAACGGARAPSPTTPTALAPTNPAAAAVSPPIDVSAVPEPPGLLVVGRVRKPDALIPTSKTWVSALVNKMTDDDMGDIVDPSQPIDVAATLSGSNRDPQLHAAFSAAVRSLDEAKIKLEEHHTLKLGPGGQFFIFGKGGSGDQSKANRHEPTGDDDDESIACVLAPAVTGARLVCGEKPALHTLTPYLTRTLPRKSWPSDVHVEIYPGAAREQLKIARTQLPMIARSLVNVSSPAMRDLIDASVGELADIVNDVDRLTFDMQAAEPLVKGTLRVDYAQATSWWAQVAASQRDRVGPPPPAFLHFPAEAAVATFSRGVDSKLLIRPSELIGNAFVELLRSSNIPQADLDAVRDLAIRRILPIFAGTTVYGMGRDDVAIAKSEDAESRGVSELVDLVGWHFAQVSEPIAKVGPMLKDVAALWNRPAFAAWAKKHGGAPRMRIAPLAAGTALPKETVHLEISFPIVDSSKSKKKVARKFVVFHFIAVPDEGTSWIGVDLDTKRLVERATALLSKTPTPGTLATANDAQSQSLRDAKISGATRLLLKSPYDGSAIFTIASEGPSREAPAGSSVATFAVPRAIVDDFVNEKFNKKLGK